jgi:hypothetical protein
MHYVDFNGTRRAQAGPQRPTPKGEDGRGFLQFPAFRSFLVDSYSSRGEGQTVADLYPAIVEWFADHEASAGGSRVGD